MPKAQTGPGTPRFVYGPVPSRRLGHSLGVDILPFKTCSLDCVYCQLGSTGKTTNRRRAYFSPRDVLAQIRAVLDSGQRVDHITFSGSGEPTLNANLGRIIRGLKKITNVPVAVLTNGTLLTRKDVRGDLLAADVVAPSLDAVPARLFRAVNRPHPSLDAGRVVKGLARFRREFRGQIWLEIMLVKGVNDTPDHIRDLRTAVAAIRPDRLQLLDGMLKLLLLKDMDFIHQRRVSKPDSEQESVKLGFRQWKCTLVFNWILCRKNHKRLGEFMCYSVHCNLMFFHRFEQCRLSLGGRAIDFIRQYDLPHYRARTKLKFPFLLVIDGNSGHVAWQHIGCELDPVE